MSELTTAPAPGISAAEQHYLSLGAREFFERQGVPVIADFLRCQGRGALAADFAALAAPGPWREPGGRSSYDKRDGSHFMYLGHQGHDR
jgi:hypothetical protein